MGSLVSKALGKEVGRMSPGARRAASAQEVEGTNELGSAWLKKANGRGYWPSAAFDNT
jgi:hypothetical protein